MGNGGNSGPVVVNYMREYQLALGIPREQVYNQTMMILAAMLMVGLVCNLLIRPVADKWFMTEAELAEEKHLAHEIINYQQESDSESKVAKPTRHITVLLAWLAVLLPLGWGIYKTLLNVSKFFS